MTSPSAIKELHKTDITPFRGGDQTLYRPARLILASFLPLLLGLPSSGCAAPNVPPSIVSLESRTQMVAPGDSVLIECVAADENGDDLSYEWTSVQGRSTDRRGR